MLPKKPKEESKLCEYERRRKDKREKKSVDDTNKKKYGIILK